MRPYGHYWRTVIRPRIIERDGRGCTRCPSAGRLDVAHLDGDNTHNQDANLAAMCRRCHRRHDYATWREKSHLTRAARKDRSRPLLQPSC